MRTVTLLAFGIASLLIAAPTANAATAAVTGTGAAAKVVYSGEALETNTVTVTYSAAGYRIDDGLAVTITAGAGCIIDAGDAVCPNAQAVADSGAEIELYLGAGNDTASVTVESATTDATIDGGPGNDGLTGVNGRYLLVGNTGADQLIGGPNLNTMFASTPLATIANSPAGITNNGGLVQINTANQHGFATGDKVNILGSTQPSVNGTRTITVVDADSFTLNGSTFTAVGGFGTAARDGATDNGPGPGDVLRVGAGPDQMTGASGDDVFDMGTTPGLGDGIPRSGTGSDTISFAKRTAPIVYSMDQEVLQAFGGGGDVATGENVGTPSPDLENVIGGSGNDLLIGGEYNNKITGGGGADVLCGGLGFDTVDYSDKDASVHATIGAADNLPANVRILRTGGITNAGGLIQVNTYGPHGLATGNSVTISRVLSAPPGGPPNPANGTHAAITVVDADSFTINGSTFTTGGGQGVVSTAATVRSIECSQGVDQTGGGEEAAADCIADDGAANEHDCIGENVENVIGGSGDDNLVGNDPVVVRTGGGTELNKRAQTFGLNVLTGGPGNDQLRGAGGTDVFEGGTGFDTVSYEDAGPNRNQPRADAVEASLNGARDDGNAGVDTEVLTDDEGSELRLTFDSIGDDIEHLVGGSGDDNMSGRGEAELIEGGAGDDRITGGAGDDELHGGEGADTMDGNDGTDQVFGEGGTDSLRGGPGADSLSGGDGTDVVDYSVSLTPINASVDGAANDGAAGEGDNVNPDVESLNGGVDNDVLAAGPGDGTVSGGNGNDVLDGGGGADTLIGGEGIDTANYAARGGPVTVTLGVPGGDGEGGENDNVTSDVENVTGGGANDALTGDDAANQLDGGGGDDNLSGLGGFDSLLGGEGNDTIFGGDASDLINGGGGNDTLNGEGGNDTMNGGAGDDTHDGGPGGDQMGAGGGNDRVTYASRSNDVDVTLDGNADDGEANENDFIRSDIARVTTGSGDDTVDSRDGLAGEISCGAGTDAVQADIDDDISNNCEESTVGALRTNRCAISGTVSNSSSSVTVRTSCPLAASGTMTIQTAGKMRLSKKSKARVLRMGRKKFTLGQAGQSKRISVKLSKDAKRVLRRHSRVRVRALVRVKPRVKASVKTLKDSRTLMLRGGKKR